LGGAGWFFAGLGGVKVLGEEGAEEAEERGEGVVADGDERPEHINSHTAEDW
jgi:hypothetical protein